MPLRRRNASGRAPHASYGAHIGCTTSGARARVACYPLLGCAPPSPFIALRTFSRAVVPITAVKRIRVSSTPQPPRPANSTPTYTQLLMVALYCLLRRDGTMLCTFSAFRQPRASTDLASEATLGSGSFAVCSAAV